MFPEAVVVQPMARSSCSVAPAGTDQLDMEAAEQLIQLSGGDGAAANDDDAGSESKSADSVKCRSKEKEKEKEAAVDSHRSRRSAGRIPADGTGKDGNGGGGGESDDIKGVDSFACCSATAADVVEKEEEKVVVVESCRRRTAAAQRFPAGKKDHRDGGIVRGEARKRPRFRSLADVYRDTEPGRLTTAGGGEAHADRDDPPEGEKEKKRAADAVIADAVHAKASKARRSGQSAHTRM